MKAQLYTAICKRNVGRSTGVFVALFAMAMAMTTQSCTSDITIDPTLFKSKLVVNALITPDRYFEVDVRTSVLSNSGESSEIPDSVEVFITDLTKNNVMRLFREDSTWVAPQIYPKAGHEYYLEVTAPGYDPVQAYTMVPEEIGRFELNISDYLLEPSETTPQKKNLSYTLNVDLTEAQTTTGYLHLIFSQETVLNTGSINEPNYEQYRYPVEPEFPEEDGYVIHIQNGVMVDLQGAHYPDVLSFTFRDYTIDDLEQIGHFNLELRQVSEDYFDYFVSLKRQMVAREDPFAEPIQAFTNIESGLGCFTSYQSNSTSISFPE